MGKLIFKSFAVVGLGLLGFTLYQASPSTHRADLAGTVAAGNGLIQSLTNKVAPASDRGISEFTASLSSYADSGNNFLRINGLRARAELATMTGSLPSTLGDWLPKSGSNWIQSTAQAASQAAGNNSGAAAKKIPLVNTALDATKQRIAQLVNR